jgi:hypothetical protein
MKDEDCEGTKISYKYISSSKVIYYRAGIALMMEAVNTSETLVSYWVTTRRNIPNDCHLQCHLLITTVVHFFSYDVRWDTQQPTTITGWGQPSTEAFGCSLAALRDICILRSSLQYSVVTFCRIGIASQPDLEICTGRNCRTSLGPRTIWPKPEVYLQTCQNVG